MINVLSGSDNNREGKKGLWHVLVSVECSDIVGYEDTVYAYGEREEVIQTHTWKHPMDKKKESIVT